MQNSHRFLVAIVLLSLAALPLLVGEANRLTIRQYGVPGQAVTVEPASSISASTVTATATVTSTVTSSLIIPTKLSLALSSNSVRVSQRVTITLTLVGQSQGQNATLPNQQVSISSTWGSTVNCVTQNDGACRLEINAPSAAGTYTITAKYSGSIFFATSTATVSLKVQ